MASPSTYSSYTQRLGVSHDARPPLEEYQIGWICALPHEAAAAQEMLDEEFGSLDQQDNTDPNIYTLGRVGKHHVVIACLSGQYGTTSATTVANHMIRTFSQSLRIGLMVGIGGGIPSTENDIRLGDIVISYPSGTCGGVFQHDMVKVSQDGKLHRTGFLNSPPRLLLAAANEMRKSSLRRDPLYPIYLEQTIQKNARLQKNFSPPDPSTDRLFQIQNTHPATADTCDNCLTEWEVKRVEREDKIPQPHYGIIASGNSVVKDGKAREQLQKETGALCCEMEAAGLMQDFPCIVIRGICDYADGHKNKQWQNYAALAAASYTKELLNYVPRFQVSQEKLMVDICSSIDKQFKDIKDTSNFIHQKLDLGKLEIAKEAIFNSYENEHDECLPGTRVELLNQVEAWAKSAHGQYIFWLNGMAGTGKSTISRTVAARLRQQGELAASFFFKRGEGDRGTAKKLFPTLIDQLASKNARLASEVRKAIQDDQNISSEDPTEQFDKLIFQPLLKLDSSEFTSIVMVIDALDECEPGHKSQLILQLLSKLQDIKSVRLRVFLTSRPEVSIRLGFKENQIHQDLILHELPKPVIKHDIRVFLEYKLARIREEHPISTLHPFRRDWPGNDNIEKLVNMSVPLFIFAATLSRFIGDEDEIPDDRLNSIIEDKAMASASYMERTYQPVLNRLLDAKMESEQPQVLQDFRNIIGVIILLATPLSIKVIAQLTQICEKTITLRLNKLYAVLNVPSNVEAPVRILHLSFRDYLLTTNVKKFRVDERKTHKTIAFHCLRAMETQLKENICELPSYGIQHDSINSEIINKHLTGDLQYACRYWTYHLEQSGIQVEDDDTFHNLIEHHVLHWLEVMCLMRNVHEAIKMLDILSRLTSSRQCFKFHRSIEDIRQFSLSNLTVMSQAPLQIYLSCLTFASSDSLVREKFGDRVFEWMEYFPEIQSNRQLPFQTLETWSGRPESLQGVAFSDDGATLASIANNSIQLWNTENGTCLSTLEDAHEFDTIALASDGEKLLTVTSSLMICVQDLKNMSEKKIINGLKGENRKFVALSRQARTIAVWSSHDVTIWEVAETGCKRKCTIECTEQPNTVALSDDGQIVASAGYDTQTFDTATGHLLLNFEEHDNKLLASGSSFEISLWNLITGQHIQTLNDHRQQVTSLQFLGTSNILASGSTDCTVRLWHISPANALGASRHVDRQIHTMCFLKDGDILAVAYKDGMIGLWNSKVGRPSHTLVGHDDEQISSSVDQKVMASISMDMTIRLWDMIAYRCLHILRGHKHYIQRATFSPDGVILASASRDTVILLWNTRTGSCLHRLTGHTGWVTGLAFSHDGEILASAGYDRTIRVWDVETKHCLRTLVSNKGVKDLAFSGNGDVLASASGSLEGPCKR
ncbi:WD40-repeat-containing domain protein [Aspergillus taichungensis]|uniref:WD40-repeat-containing domain protein n=1 Tax=Aspergillus taichungensis TaxID=482145 RepID=A0A2J5HT95_9EURO|nr:WD40-repeat-containing domain protein [Aspergillus taichungensis]